jgi:hypothetical protein
MAGPPDQPQPDIYAALNERFKNQGLLVSFPDGLIAAEEIPGSNFPYAVFDPSSETVQVATSTGEYSGGTINVSIYDKTFDLVKAWARQIRVALRWAPLPLTTTNGLKALCCKPGATRYFKEETFWKAVLEFDILTGEAINRAPEPGQTA